MERQTKIVCTIGPATENPEMLKKLIIAGMNVARVNFSHGTHEQHARVIENIRSISSEMNISVGILQDLTGPKIRTGDVESNLVLKYGSELVLVEQESVNENNRISVSYYDCLAENLKPGDQIYLSDGSIQLNVKNISKAGISCQVVTDGILRSRQGINVPGVNLHIPAVTAKDLIDLEFGIEHDVDFVALSFVQNSSDLILIKHALQIRKARIPVIAKIEKHEALENINNIIDKSDGIMIARGDLGIEIPLEQVPVTQKMIINKAGLKGKPVITATQMLESMINNPKPTRAEATDVANAIFDGTDAVMLSGETAIGKHPIKAVEMMDKIARSTEAVLPYEDILVQRHEAVNKTIPDAISHAACYTAQYIGAKAIICCTQSGYTARMVAKYRPKPRVIAVTPVETTYRQLSLPWDILPLKINQAEDTDDMIEKAKRRAKDAGLVNTGDVVVITAGVPIGIPGKTNIIKADEI
ncbi:pyruvate kinase [Candidatus Poribacteria bacterium]|nr:pyruvate kinase [Candidatus Poribacteria bacterium]